MTEYEVTTFLVKILSGNGHPRPIKGSDLSAFLRASLPDFTPPTFGYKNLRDFIRRYASEQIAEVGRAGMDVVYSLRSEQQQPLFPLQVPEPRVPHERGPVAQLLANPRIWKTFASPDNPFHLFLEPRSKRIFVIRPGYTPDPSWREISHITADKLHEIGKDFVAELPEYQQVPLAKVLEQPKWWLPFYELMGTLGIKARWVMYRRRRIADEFVRLLPDVPAQDYEEKPAPPQVLPERTSTPTPEIQRIATAVVQRMTDSELRSLNLPLGYVMDVLTTR
jgi:hypothetical protein